MVTFSFYIYIFTDKSFYTSDPLVTDLDKFVKGRPSADYKT